MADEAQGDIYLIKTNQGNFRARLNRAPTLEESADLAANYFKSTTPDQKTALPSITSSSQAGGLNKPHGGLAVDLALEGAMPAAAQAAASEFGPAAVAVTGGLTSALGNTLAQLRRMVAGEQEDFSAGQLTAATATGAIPFVGPAKNAAKLAQPVVKGVLQTGKIGAAVQAGKTGATMGLVGAAGENIKLAIDEGRLATPGENFKASLIPGILGTTASGIASGAEGMSRSGRAVAENAKDYSSLPSNPTAGMLLPEELAATEQGIARRSPRGKVAQSVDVVKNELSAGIQNVAPNPQEGADIFKTASPLIRQVSSAEDEVAKLNTVALKANDEVKTAFAKLGEAKATGQADVQKAVAKEAERFSEKAFDANLQSALENAKEISANRAAGSDSGLDPATGRDLWVEHVAKPVVAGFDKRAAELYSIVDNDAQVFNPKPITAYAHQLASDVTGGLPKKLDASIAMVAENLGPGEAVSLQALRNARAELLRKVRVGDIDSNNEERLIKGIASEITRQIDAQAVSALGREGGEGLLAANKFYREGKELFDQEGVDALFASKPNDASVRKIILGMEKSGINADEYKNVQNLISRIGSEVPGLAESAQTHVNDIIKRSIVYDASRVNPASATGELVVDPEALLGSLRKLGKVPGTLERLGLGSGAAVSELETLFAKYPEATQMKAKEWDQLFSSPAFRAETIGKPWSKSELATNLKETMAATQADNQIIKAANLRAAGLVDEARAAYGKASDTLRTVNGDFAAANQRYEALLKDPVALAFNNPNLGESDFNSFARSLFDPKASKTTNADVGKIAGALRQSPNPANRELLTRLQERYIADRIAAYHSTPTTSTMLKHPDSEAVALFFNPVNPGDAANELFRARKLLEPEQLNQLSAFAKTAKAVAQYEKLGIVPVRSGSYDVPVVGRPRRALEAIVDLYRVGKYNIAAKLLADPKKFSSVAINVGDELKDDAAILQQFGVGAGRVQSNRRDVNPALRR